MNDTNEDLNENEEEFLQQPYVYSNEVVIRDIDIPFIDLVLFLVKLAIASIPAGILLLIIYGLGTLALGLFGLATLLS